MVSIVTKAEYIDFKKDKVSDRKELVIDVYFVHDLQQKILREKIEVKKLTIPA